MKALYSCLLLLFVLLLLLRTLVYSSKPAKYLDLVLGEHSNDIVLKGNRKVVATFIFASDIEGDYVSTESLLIFDEVKNSDAIFITGDITRLGTEEDMQKIYNTLSKYDKNIYLVPGDRDLWKSGITNFNKVFGESYKIVEVRGSTFLLIDNSDEYAGISDDQWKFIEDNISNADFIVLHNPIYFDGSPLSTLFHKGMGQYSVEVESQRLRLLDLIRNSDVNAVFAGDQHIFSREIDNTKQGLEYYVIGSLNFERSLSGSTYAILKVYDDGQYSVESRNLTLQ